MKASVQTLNPAQSMEKTRVAVLSELVKARLTSLVVLTTVVGYYLGERGPLDYARLLNTLMGTAMVAAGAAALNQWLERDYDALMQRTADRPLPSGRLQPPTVLWFGVVLSALGLGQLALTVNPVTAGLGAITLLSYLFVYTPLKRVTPLNTIVGAIPGALPPLMGWTAARGEVTTAGWSLFAVLFFWQLPHFMSIAWLYRDDYARAGFQMLPVVDPGGERTGRQTLSHALGLLPVSLCPALLGLTGWVYLLGATVLGAVFIGFAVRFARQLTRLRARQLFYVSILYLPLVLGLMVLDKVGY
jgi:heme o synthase